MANTENAELPQPAQVRWIEWFERAFRYRPQFIKCCKDGTCKPMTPELRATMQPSDQKRYDDIYRFQFPEAHKYDGGPLYCGKEPGICASNHCRSVHFRLADAAGASNNQ